MSGLKSGDGYSSYYEAGPGLEYKTFYSHFLKQSQGISTSPFTMGDSRRNKRSHASLRVVKMLSHNDNDKNGMPKLEAVNPNKATEERAEAELKRQGVKSSKTTAKRHLKAQPQKKKKSKKPKKTTPKIPLKKIKDIFSQ